MNNTRIAFSLTIASILVLGAFLIPLSPVHADSQAPPGDKWSPVGPYIREILIKHYATTGTEFTAFGSKDIDQTDWPFGLANINQFVPSAEHTVTPENQEFGAFEVQFNFANTHFGIPFDFGNNIAGVNLRQAVGHCVDKKAHITTVLSGLGDAIDEMLAPAEVPAGTTPRPDFRLYDTLPHGANTISAFNLADDATPVPAVDSADWLGAKEHLIAAGFTESTATTPGGNRLLNAPTGTVDFYIRSDDPRRSTLGLNIATCWNSLFAGGAGGLNVLPRSITDVFPIVFTAVPVFDWHWYTGGFSLGAQWTHLYPLFHSAFASSQCGGRQTRLPDNYWFSCVTSLDTALAGSPFGSGGLFFSTDLTTSLNFATQAMLIIGQKALNIEIWSSISRFGFLSGWQGMVNSKGFGPPAFFTSVNAFCGTPAAGSPYLASTCPTGADAAAGRLRWGFRQGTNILNAFGFGTLWEDFILGRVYDSLLANNPYNPTQLTSNAANRWQVFQDGAGLGYVPPTGTKTSLRFQLRPNVFFHDGVTKLTAKDIRFTIINYRDVPSDTFFSSVINVLDVTILSNTLVDVHLNAKSPFWEGTIGGLYILNSKAWDANNDGIVDTGLDRSDVVSNGILAQDGFGPYRFVSTTGGDQAIEVGSSTLLSAFKPASPSAANNQYLRSSGIYRNFAWADINNGAGLTVDIIDVASVALCFNKPATGSCAYWDTVAGGNGEGGKTPLVGLVGNTVDIVEFSAVASNFGQQWLFPATWSATNYVNIQSFPYVPPA